MAGTVTVARTTGAAEGEAFDVIRGSIVMPRTGAWTADLHLVGSVNLAGTVVVRAGERALAGTVVKSKVHEGRAKMRLVAGAGGLGKTARPKHYVDPTLGHVLQDLCRDGGERLSADSEAAALRHSLGAWTTTAATVGQMIAAAVGRYPGGVWRHAPDGTIWVGRETWPDSGFDDDTLRELDEDVEAGSRLYGLDQPTLLPGTVVDGVRADTVEHLIEETTIRTRVWEARADGRPIDRLKGAFAAQVRASEPAELYRHLWRARIVTQSDDLLRVGVVPDDPRLPPMDAVVLRTGVPGVTVQVAAGAHLRIGWDDGDPTRPFACLWDGPGSIGGADAGGGAVRRVILAASMVELGALEGQPPPLGTTLYAYLAALQTGLCLHTHVGVTTGPGTSGPPPPATFFAPPTPPSTALPARLPLKPEVLAANVKVK